MIKIILTSCLLSFNIYAFGQSAETKVLTATNNLMEAMVNADEKALSMLTSESLSYGHSGGLVEGRKEFIEKIVSGKSDFVSIKLSDQSVIISGKTAIVRHTLNAVTNDGGKSGEVHLKILLVWQKNGRNWLLIARQAVKFTP